MNLNLTELVYIIDRSGSMHSLTGDTVGVTTHSSKSRRSLTDRHISRQSSSMTSIRYEPYIMHQSDVIDLLVGALRDALDKKPKRKNVKFAPCTCGYNTHSEWYNCENHVWSYECNKCGRKSDKYAAKTKIEARIGWNKMIEDLKVGEVHD